MGFRWQRRYQFAIKRWPTLGHLPQFQTLKQSTNPPWDGEQGPMNEFNLERFAELIVAECIKLNGKELAMPGHSRMVDVYCDHFGIKF